MEINKKIENKQTNIITIKNKNSLKINFKQKIQNTRKTSDNSTNLYVQNLNIRITEQQLISIFGKYGPLANIKMILPGYVKAKYCAFVAFMSQRDAVHAYCELTDTILKGCVLNISWGKPVPIPDTPIYIPSQLLNLSKNPSSSGLPFNAQLCFKHKHINQQMRDLQDLLSCLVIKVVIPTNKNVLMIIHRMIEFVIREGPMFEALIIQREQNNPLFKFLLDNKSQEHVYYRWRMFSILQGDSYNDWKCKDFRMFEGGSIWRPPKKIDYTKGMNKLMMKVNKNLSTSQRDKFERILRHITNNEEYIRKAAMFCIYHSEAAHEIVKCINESLTNPHTEIKKKMIRIFLINGILQNCNITQNGFQYIKSFEYRLLNIIKFIHHSCTKVNEMKAEGCKFRVSKILSLWQKSNIYSKQFMLQLQETLQIRDVRRYKAPSIQYKSKY